MATATIENHRWWADFGIRELHSQVLPGLFIGGTADDDTIFDVDVSAMTGEPAWYPHIRKSEYDSVVTLYGGARPAGSRVQELRWSIPDSQDEIDLAGMRELVRWAHSQWNDGKRVLVRCQAGLNRSGMVTALILVRDGYEPQRAIDLVRKVRSQRALFNEGFVRFVLNTPIENWRD